MKAITTLIVGCLLMLMCGFAYAPASAPVQITPNITTPKVTATELRCLAQTIYFEARGEPVAGQRAVAEVVMNRREAGFAKTICGVVFQRGQFAWTHGRRKVTDKVAYSNAESLAFRTLAGSEARDSRKFLYFFTGHKPMWASKLHKTFRIRNHLFLW